MSSQEPSQLKQAPSQGLSDTERLEFKATTSPGGVSAQQPSLGDKEKSLRLGCAQIVLDYQRNDTGRPILHGCP